MRSPTTVFTKCLKIKLKVNTESQKSFPAVDWAEWELWRLMVLLHTVWEPLESPAHNLIPIHHLGKRSQVLFCCSWSYPWSNQDPSTFFWATDHQQLTIADFLSLVSSLWISIIYMLKTTTEFTFIPTPTKILSSCRISAMICSLPKDRKHWVGDTILQCH